jgi:hypothetical protein
MEIKFLMNIYWIDIHRIKIIEVMFIGFIILNCYSLSWIT